MIFLSIEVICIQLNKALYKEYNLFTLIMSDKSKAVSIFSKQKKTGLYKIIRWRRFEIGPQMSLSFIY